MASRQFQRLIRFVAKDGKTHYGDAVTAGGVNDLAKTQRARVISGDIFGSHTIASQEVEVVKLLSPLASKDVGTVRCLGLNYIDHAKETKMPIPSYPVLFYKPPSSLASPSDNIPVPLMAQEDDSVDFECELVIVIGKKGADIAEDDAYDHVLGYAVGNDVSHRGWQLKKGGGQWSLGKGFDAWAPYGPAIVTQKVVGDPQHLAIWTKVNGELLQDGNTANQIFGVSKAVSLLSRGTTLMPGDLIFTGTPHGVGVAREPPRFLKDGDVVEVGLEKVGTCTNKMEFVKTKSKL